MQVLQPFLENGQPTDACGNIAYLNQEIHLSCGVKVYNTVTPNGDGKMIFLLRRN